MKRWLFLIPWEWSGACCEVAPFEGIYVATPSMEPTLSRGGPLFRGQGVPLFQAAPKGEIIVFPSPVAKDKDLIKRVVGLPGETFEIREKKVYIDDKTPG